MRWLSFSILILFSLPSLAEIRIEPIPDSRFPFNSVVKLIINHSILNCTGTLVSANVVLTARHCLGNDPNVFKNKISVQFLDGKEASIKDVYYGGAAGWGKGIDEIPDSHFDWGYDWGLVRLQSSYPERGPFPRIGEMLLGELFDVGFTASDPQGIVVRNCSVSFFPSGRHDVDGYNAKGAYKTSCPLGPAMSGGPMFSCSQDTSGNYKTCVVKAVNSGYIDDTKKTNFYVCKVGSDVRKAAKECPEN